MKHDCNRDGHKWTEWGNFRVVEEIQRTFFGRRKVVWITLASRYCRYCHKVEHCEVKL